MSRSNAICDNSNQPDVNFRKLKKKLNEYDIYWDSSVGCGSHGAFVGLTRITKTREAFPLPKKQQREVQSKYLKTLRRAFELLPEHGVSDEDFFA